MAASSLLKRWGQAMIVPAIVFAAVAGLLWFLTREVIALQGLVTHTQQVKDHLAEIFDNVQEAESATRGFALSRDERYLASYDKIVQEMPGHLQELAALTRDNATQAKNAATLRADIDARLAILKAVIGNIKAGRATNDGVAPGAGPATMQTVRATVATMNAEENRLLAPRRQSVGRMVAVIQLFSYGLLFVIMTAAIIGLAKARRQRDELEATQATLRATNDKLTVEMGERAKIEAQLRQVQKMEAIGHLTGGIAHDFNNMLAVIIGALNIMQRRIDRGDYNIGSFVQAAIEGAQRGGALTQRLLAFARKQMLEPRPIDVNKLVSGMSELLRRTLGETIQTEVILAGGLWRSFVDAHQLETTILNLVVNARDAMPEGGKLTIETANAYLDDSYARDQADVQAGQYVMIGVSDTGHGMTPEVVAKAFDPFFTTKGAGRGTGLGLSQVYGFVKQSGGHVKIYSEPGHGATIKVYLPRHHGAVDDSIAAKTSSTDLPRAKGETILVVEDEDAVRRLAVEGLQELGYKVVEAESGQAGLAMLERTPEVKMVFTDIVMPNMNGRQMTDEALKRRPDLRVLYTTGYTRNAVVHNGTLDPGVKLLGKPYTLAQLARGIRDILDA